MADMSATEVNAAPNGVENTEMQGSGCGLLVVVGEPFTDAHKELILEEITKGFKSWDDAAHGCDINAELAAVAAAAASGEEGPSGERVITHAADNLQTEVLIFPTAQTLTGRVRSLLSASLRHKHIIYAGHAIQGTGSWVLQDDVFSFANMIQACRSPDVEPGLTQNDCTLSIHCPGEGDWSTTALSKECKNIKGKINPDDHLPELAGVVQFTAYLSSFIKCRDVGDLLQSSDVVGNIRFSKPTLYIFPGGEGDSSLFGISGFNLLINGGYSRKACFWDFTRHLDRIDAILLTHLSSDNIFGISSVLQRKSAENVHPEVGYVYYNAVENAKSQSEEEGLLVNVLNEANKVVGNMKDIGHSPTPCFRTNSAGITPINLYHKVGHGSLDMYILNPVQDSKELKDFLTQWNKNVRHFSNVKMPQQIPLPEVLSVCALLVWKPADPDEQITRIFFPGNAPQQRIFEGLDKLKTIDFLKHPTCCDNDLHSKGRKSSTTSKTSKAPTKARPAAAERKAPSKSPSPPKAATPVKETAKKPAVPKSTGDKKKAKGSVSSASSEPKSSPSETPSDAPANLIPEIKASVKDEPAPAAKEPEPLIPDVVAAEPKKEEPVPAAEPVQNLMDSSPQGEPAPITPKEEFQPLVPDVAEPVKTEPPPVSPEPVEPAPPSPKPEESASEPAVEAAPPTPEPVETAPLAPEPVDAAPLSPEPVQSAPAENPAQEPELISMEPESAPEVPKDVPRPEAAWEEPPKAAPVEDVKPAEPIVPDVAQSDELAPAESEEPAKESVPEPPAEPMLETPEALPDPAQIDLESYEPQPVEMMHGEPKQEQEVEEHEIEACEINKEQASLEEMGIYDDTAVAEDETDMAGQAPQENLEDVGVDVQQQATPESPDYPFFTPQQSMAKDSFDVPEPKDLLTEIPESEPVEPQRPEEPLEPERPDEPVDTQGHVEPMEPQRPEELAMNPEDSMPAPPDAAPLADLSPEDVQNANFSPDVPEEPVATDKHALEDLGIYDDDAANGNTDHADEKPDLLSASEGGAGEEDRSRESSVPSSVPSDSLSRETPDTEIEMTGDQADEREESPERREPFVEDQPTIGEPTPTELEPTSAPDLIQVEAGNAAIVDEGDLLGDVSPPQEQPNLIDEPQENLMEQPAMFDDPTCNTTQPSSQPIFDNFGAPSDPFTDNSPQSDQHTPQSDLMTPHSDVPSPSSNPFVDNVQSDSTSPVSSNPFYGIESSEPFQPPVEPPPCNPFEGMPDPPADGTAGGQQDMAPFDPIQGWGEPMGLPSPPPPEEGGTATNAVNSVANDKAAEPKTATKKPAAKAGATKKAADVKKAAGDKKSPVSPTKPLKRGSPAPSSAKPTANGKATRDAKDTKEVTKRPSSAPKKTRPVSAPAPKADAPAKKSAPASKPTSAKSRAASSSAAPAKAKPLTPVVPVYVDLTYVPHHGNGAYCDIDFFRRIRARYYVISSVNPPASVFTALLDAKQTWEDANLEVTIIPTYDNDTLRHWMGLHRDQLSDLKIDVAPSASRCTIQLQDHETSCAAYRLEF